MGLTDSIAARAEELSHKWAELILGTYPEQTQAVWRTHHDPFPNPVGAAIKGATDRLIPLLLTWNDAEAVANSLEQLVKIRAVQDFPPSRALSFVFLLKKLLRQEFMADLSAKGELEELLRFETRVDNLAVIAFDLYVAARDQIARMRVEEVKRAHKNLVRRVNNMGITAHKAE